MDHLLTALLQKAPDWVNQVLIIIGAFRLVFKPLMTFLQKLVKITPTQKDDRLLHRLMSSKLYHGLCFLLDLIVSIKLPRR